MLYQYIYRDLLNIKHALTLISLSSSAEGDVALLDKYYPKYMWNEAVKHSIRKVDQELIHAKLPFDLI